MALGLGTSAAYAWWCVLYEPFIRVEHVTDRVYAGTATTSLPVSFPSTLCLIIFELVLITCIVRRQEEFYLKLEREKQAAA